ncbi:vancomycin resistance protein YoaR [Naumannella cuiyingiana]|uniref:Vancomycin resistance protein YoaR n=1 Tax=Naumannella cuiyingiana TaxID=1347891 RepID=A0A7Z0DAS4_9ACTN|nr:VanW family protein [Naumannella cuiyingiana]NYI71937.1 vancomycin resistance protein YoaR [Naumannella cuiyingiana]
MTTTTKAGSRPDPSRDKPRRRGWVVGLVVALFVLALGGLYLAGYLAAGDVVPRNASVAGISLGGLPRAEANDKLRAELAEAESAELELRAGEKTATVKPADAGLAIDYEATLAATGVGRSASPAHILRVLTGGGATEPVVAVDEAALTAAVDAAAKQLDTEPKDASIKFDVPREGAPKIVKEPGQQSVRVDRAAAAEELRSAYLTATTVPVTAAVQDPDISTAEVEQLATEWAEPAISGPITAKTDKGEFKVTERAIAKSTRFEAVDGAPKARIDAKELRSQTNPEITKNVKLSKPQDAGFRFEGGRPVVTKSKDGDDIMPDKLLAAVEPVVTKSEGRSIEVPIDQAKAELDAAAAEKLGVKEVVGEFTTRFPHADYRNANIGRAAEVLTGVLIKPDETFSFNETVGERTTANGFVEGTIISNGRFVKETGGGVSQSVTTLYNAGFFAGLEDVEHWPHTLYIDRYPVGREATVAWGSKDLKIKNNTPYGVVIQGIINKSTPGNRGSITFKMWSTKYYEVKTAEPRKSDFYTDPPTTDSSSSCQPQGEVPGFTATYWRELYRDGKLAKPRENYSWRYYATREVTCN